MTAEERVKSWVQPDGGLYGLGAYIAWTPGDNSVVLDGDFTAEEILAILRHVVAQMKLDLLGPAL